MIMSLQEIMDTCPNWERFCELLGFSEWVVNEGGGHIQVNLTTDQAHHLGIVRLIDWKIKSFKETFPGKEELENL